MSDKEWYSQSEAARALGVTRQTMRNWRKDGTCPASFVHGITGRIRIPAEWVEKMEAIANGNK